MPGAAIIEVVAIHRRNDHMGQTQLRQRFCDMLRLVRIELIGLAGCDALLLRCIGSQHQR